MFAKGLIYGVSVIALNSLLLHLAMKHILAKQKKFVVLTFVLCYVSRYAVLGGLVYLFLRNRWGSPLGLLVGISVGLFAFLLTRRFS